MSVTKSDTSGLLDIQSVVVRRDTEYLEQYPYIQSYVRKHVFGEFGVHECEEWARVATHVVVRWTPLGVTREPMMLLLATDYPNGKIPAEHLEAFHAEGIRVSHGEDTGLVMVPQEQIVDELGDWFELGFVPRFVPGLN
jgi:hypothetical protein